MQSEEIEKLIEFAEHFIAEIHEIGVYRFQRFYERSFHVCDAFFDELHNTGFAHVLELDSVCAGGKFWPFIGTHIHLYIFIDSSVKGVYNSIGRLVTRVGVCLPVVQLDLVAHMQKKINVVGAHSILYPSKMADTSQPCVACRRTLGRLVKPHLPSACPLKKILYCGVCSIRGHSPGTCPNSQAKQLREISIDASSLENVVEEEPLQPIVEVPASEEALRAFVSAFGGKPMICQEQGKKVGRELEENKKRLKSLLKPYGIIVTTPPEDSEIIASVKEMCMRKKKKEIEEKDGKEKDKKALQKSKEGKEVKEGGAAAAAAARRS